MERYLRRKTLFLALFAVAACWFFPLTCLAHFGVLIPSEDIVEGNDSREIRLLCQFMHPFGQVYMEMERPLQFGVFSRGKKENLLDSLKKRTDNGYASWLGSTTIKHPGDHIFFMVPKPYWEPSENTYIQHITKVVVNTFGLEDGWDKPVGLRTEIVPMTRPYGLWTGNLFCGQVLLDGKPAPNCEVEVEYYNSGRKVVPPKGPYITQVVRTDSTGCFCYAMPRGGWWGFAALNEATEKMDHEGKQVPLELGAVIWVQARDMK
jgi:cobalt/nickel transport protein